MCADQGPAAQDAGIARARTLRQHARELLAARRLVPLDPQPLRRQVQQVETARELVAFRVGQRDAGTHQLIGEHVAQRTALELTRKIAGAGKTPQLAAVLTHQERCAALRDVIQQSHDRERRKRGARIATRAAPAAGRGGTSGAHCARADPPRGPARRYLDLRRCQGIDLATIDDSLLAMPVVV